LEILAQKYTYILLLYVLYLELLFKNLDFELALFSIFRFQRPRPVQQGVYSLFWDVRTILQEAQRKSRGVAYPEKLDKVGIPALLTS
jgi:hypothetical protein